MSSKKTQTIKYKRKKPSPRASIEVLIKREEAKLEKLKRQQALVKIRQEVRELQDFIKKGY